VRRKRPVLGLAAAAFVGLSATALATFTAEVFYDPPLVRFHDPATFDTPENVRITVEGDSFVFANSNGSVQSPGSDPGCTDNFSTEYECPTAGIERLEALLGGLGDIARIDLGPLADSVTQVLRGQSEADRIHGGPGRQKINGGAEGDLIKGHAGRDKLLGGDGDDRIFGGAAPDVLIGGEGDDTCLGGPGHDVKIGCE
jgi:Ca2+-binding RTX toxin-like protein